MEPTQNPETVANALKMFSLENPMMKPAAREMAPAPAPKGAPEKKGLVTAKAMTDCAKFTKGAASLVHPRYSFTVLGISALCDPHPDQYGIGKLFGTLVLMAAPVEEVIRGAVIVGGTIGGSAATVVTAAAAGTEWVGREASNAIHTAHSNNSQPTPKTIRENMVKNFVERMLIAINSKDLSFGQQNRFKENPGELIGLLALTIAHQSRNLPGRQLMTSKGVITKESIAGLDNTSKDYFDGLCEMKFGIEKLGLYHDNVHAWQQLVPKLIGCSSNPPVNVDDDHIEILQTIIATADSLSSKFVEDEGFQALWKKSYSKPVVTPLGRKDKGRAREHIARSAVECCRPCAAFLLQNRVHGSFF